MGDNDWTGELSPDLNELAAFDAMRAFLEAYWERGGRSDDGLAMLMSNLNRSSWADHSPGDPAMWEDWKNAVTLIRKASGGAAVDPLEGGLTDGN
jgi:hypothetical protein